MELINLTPHTIDIVNDAIISIPPSGTVARVSTKIVQAGEVAGIPLVRIEYGQVENLPAPEPGKVYIVSALVASRVVGRDDVFAPDTNRAVRNEANQIVGVPGLVRY